MTTRTRAILFPLLAAALSLALTGCQAPQASAEPAARAPSDSELLARGDYLVRIAGCNDCHTPGYTDSQGDVDRALWLIGSPLGFSGPWGTTYAANLRLKAADKDEAAWLAYTADLHTRPMMPDFAVRAMSEDDRRALYRLIRSLGVPGDPAPTFLPPGQTPPAPYIQLVLPAQPAASAAAASPGSPDAPFAATGPG